jgi:hypothetical protein
MGRPQAVINEQIGRYDIFVGVMWKRFGTPSEATDSGTEEEFNLAYEEWKRNGEIHIAFYFCQAKYKPNKVHELEQAGKVLKFQDELKSKGLTWEYPNAGTFADIVRPHLIEILYEMFEKKAAIERPLGVIQRLRQLQDELDKASAHHRLVVNSAGEFTVHPKHARADDEEPLKISARFEFPDTEVGREIQEKFNLSLATGRMVTIPKEYIKYLKLPDVFSPLLNTLGEGTESVTIGGVVPPRLVLLNLILRGDEGEEIELENIEFETSRPNIETVVLFNEKHPSPWKFTLTLNLVEGTLLFNYNVDYPGLNAKRELEAMRFTNAFAKGGTLELIHVDTGFTLQTVKVAPGLVAPSEPKLLSLIEKAAFIQSKIRVPIVIPEASEGEENAISVKDIHAVFETAQKLETGRAIINVANWQTEVGLEVAKNLLLLFDRGEPVSLSFSFEDEVVNLFGTEVHLGLVVLTCERTVMAKEDLESLRSAIAENQQHNIKVRFTPSENAPMLANYPRWLSKEHGDFLIHQMEAAEKKKIQDMNITVDR